MKTSMFLVVLAMTLAGVAGELPFAADGVRFAAKPLTIWTKDERFAYAREPLLARMEDGSLICVLYTGGRREPDTNNVVAVVRSVDDGTTWTKPEVVFSHPHRACWATELNTLGGKPELVFQTFDAHTHYSDLRPWRCWTSDSGRTWTNPIAYVGLPPSFTTRQGLRLADGALVYPIYWQECDGDYTGWVSYEGKGIDWSSWNRNGQWWFASGAIRSEDGGKTWTFASVPPADLRAGRRLNQWEPAIVELKPGQLRMFVRVECDERVLWESDSSDGGRTWSKLRPGAISNPGTKMQVLSRKGEVILFNNVCDPKMPNRYRMEAAISKDGCRTWRHIPLADSSGSSADGADWFNGSHVQVAYPSAILDEGRRTCYLAIDSIGRFYLLKLPFSAFGW